MWSHTWSSGEAGEAGEDEVEDEDEDMDEGESVTSRRSTHLPPSLAPLCRCFTTMIVYEGKLAADVCHNSVSLEQDSAAS